MSDAIRESYDTLPYMNMVFKQLQPDALLPLGRLYGISTVGPQDCRVLELGCAGGANLIAMATRFPDARFFGYDLSPRQVEIAKGAVQALALKNLQIEAMDITRMLADAGEFDLIIAHGIWSWVPHAVQEAMFRIARNHLRPQGIAYISYNCLPGWYAKLAIREHLLRRVPAAGGPGLRLEAARRTINRSLEAARAGSGPSLGHLTELLTAMTREQDAYLYHEYLEEHNHPVYFEEFVRRAARYGLQYVTEVPVSSAHAGRLHNAWQDRSVRTAEERIAIEQDVDFVTQRMFRQTVLCRDGAASRLRPALEPVSAFWLSANIASVDRDGPTTTYIAATGKRLENPDPWLTEVLDRLLAAAPGRIAVASLLGRDAADSTRAETLSALVETGLARAWLHDPPAPTAGELRVPNYIGYMAAHNGTPLSPYCEPLSFSGLALRIVHRLDGSLSAAELRSAFERDVRDGSLVLLDGDRQVNDPAHAMTLVDGEIGATLASLRELRLLG